MEAAFGCFGVQAAVVLEGAGVRDSRRIAEMRNALSVSMRITTKIREAEGPGRS